MSICTDHTGPGHRVAEKKISKKVKSANKRERRQNASLKDLAERQTGTLKPPKNPMHHYTNRAIVDINDKAEELCRSSQSDVVVYHDERETISMRTVRDVTTMHISKFILKSYRYSEVKLKTRENRHGHKSKSEKVR